MTDLKAKTILDLVYSLYYESFKAYDVQGNIKFALFTNYHDWCPQKEADFCVIEFIN